MTDIIKELEERGYIEQLTHEKEMRELFQKESVSFYIGITKNHYVQNKLFTRRRK